MRKPAIVLVATALMTFSPGIANAYSPSAPGGFANNSYNADVRSVGCGTGYVCMSKNSGSNDTTCGGQCWETRFNTATPIPWAGINNSPISTRQWSDGTYIYSVGTQVRNRDVSSRTACYYSLNSYNPSPGAFVTKTYGSAWASFSWSGFGSWAVIPNAVGWTC